MIAFHKRSPSARDFQGNEFIVDGTAMHDSWKNAWPRAIARAWYIEEKLGEWDGYHALSTFLATACTTDTIGILKKKVEDQIRELTLKIESLEKSDVADDPIMTKRKLELTIQRSECKQLKQKTDSINEPAVNNKTIHETINDNSYALSSEDLTWYFRDSLRRFEQPETSKTLAKKDWEWFKKLLSHCSEMVLEALMEEGFILDAMETLPLDFQAEISSRLIVRRQDQDYLVHSKNTGCRLDDSSKTCYQKTCERHVRVMETPEIDKANKRTAYLGSRDNGWAEVAGLKHVLVLTLPPRPVEPEDWAMAISDYENAGRVYPFTLC